MTILKIFVLMDIFTVFIMAYSCPSKCTCNLKEIIKTADCSHLEMNTVSFAELKEYEAIDLSFNYLSNIEIKQQMPNLKYLILDHNYLSALNDLNAPNLETLDISYNRLDSLNPNICKLFKKMTNLNISNNYLTIKDILNLKACKSLENVNISNNIIEGTLDVSIFNSNLKFIDMSYNNIFTLNMDTKYKLFNNLIHLNLAHNIITSINDEDEIEKLKFNFLNIEENPIATPFDANIKSASMKAPRSLNTLEINNDEINSHKRNNLTPSAQKITDMKSYFLTDSFLSIICIILSIEIICISFQVIIIMRCINKLNNINQREIV